MGIRLLTEEELSAGAVERWRKSYEHWADEDRFSTPGRPSKGEINDALNASDQTPSEIAAILNEGWARPQCSACNKYVCAVVQLQDDWSSDASACFCTDCLGKAQRMLSRYVERSAALPDTPTREDFPKENEPKNPHPEKETG